MVKRRTNTGPEGNEENIFLPVEEKIGPVDQFDERAYLERRPDVAAAIARGVIPSALFHYQVYGRHELELAVPSSDTVQVTIQENSGGIDETVSVQPSGPAPSACHVDTVICSKSGGIFVVGWADELPSEIARLRIKNAIGECTAEQWQLVRFRRRDVEAALGFEGVRKFGFCALVASGGRGRRDGSGSACQIGVEFTNGAVALHEVEARFVDDVRLLEMALSYFGGLDFFGNKAVESLYALDDYMGNEFIRRNRELTQSIASAVSCEEFGSSSNKPRGSVIVCLYGKPEYLFLQSAAFFSSPEAADYEFIYVCNSPELVEELSKSAAASWRIYGHSLRIVALPGNAGFGVANNVAAQIAKSDRLMFVNPDVFPVNNNWAKTHSNILEQNPASTTDLFSSPLFYADGSLMHSGMYFEIDQGFSVNGMEIRRRPTIRVEHFAKGAPPSMEEFRRPRPVPAVSGAFISVKRQLFESLDGFSDRFIYGHYEDADLCLRGMQKGVVPWIHDLPLWHLEGKGSHRLPQHEGASTVNRWLFGRMWNDTITHGLAGKTPAMLANISAMSKLADRGAAETAKSDVVVASSPAKTGAGSKRPKTLKAGPEEQQFPTANKRTDRKKREPSLKASQ